MIIISYDIRDDKLRSRFAKMLLSNGAIRLQYSVYEVNNTKRLTDVIAVKIEAYSKHFTPDDSIVIFEVDHNQVTKYGNDSQRYGCGLLLINKPLSLCLSF